MGPGCFHPRNVLPPNLGIVATTLQGGRVVSILRPYLRALSNFWDGNIPAPLKLCVRGNWSESGKFLGWKHPGPIEACTVPSTVTPAAPFLGWKHPGPIEAMV